MAATLSFAFAAPAVPARLAIYYGYPGLINGAASDVPKAAGTFASYDVVVFGGGLEFDTHPDHETTRRIVAALLRTARTPEVFGYIALGPSTALDANAIEQRVRLWARMGATGIFYDEAGIDFGVPFARVAAAVRAARRYQLSVCLNAFDLSAIARGVRDSPEAALLSRRDALLVESFGLRLGRRQTRAETAERMRSAHALRTSTGVRVFGVTTAAADGTIDASDAAYARALAAEFKLDALGWGGADYGARDSRLTRP